MSDLNKKIGKAHRDEINNRHWSDDEREALVEQFERELQGQFPEGYPVEGDMVDKFIYIVYDY